VKDAAINCKGTQVFMQAVDHVTEVG